MASASLSEKKYDPKFSTAATASASNMPLGPPSIRPMNISSRVSAVSRNAVLNVLPINLLYQDRCGRHRGDACLLGTQKAQALKTKSGLNAGEEPATDFHGSSRIFLCSCS